MAGRRRGMGQAGAAFGYRDYRLFWSGAVVSNIGTWMQNVTVPYVLFQLTHSGVWVGLAVVAQVLPSIVLNPVSGWLADRFSRRGQLLWSNAAQAVAAMGLWALWVSGARSPTGILALVAVGGTASMVVQPAWQAFVTDLVPAEHLLNAITLNSAQANGARAVGPAIGGIVLGTLGPSAAFLLNGVSFLVVLVTLGLLNPPGRRFEPAGGGIMEQYREAAAYARQRTGLLVAYALTAVVCGLGNPIFQLATLFTEQIYVVGPGWYGVLTGAYGVGAVLGALVMATVGAGKTRGHTMVVVLGIHAVAAIGFGLSRNVVLGALMLALVGAGSLCSVATLNTSIQTSAPERLRGRLLALWVLSYTVSYPLGSLLQGYLADVFGAGPTVTLAGLLMLGTVGVLLVRPKLAASLDGDPEVVVVDPLPAPAPG